MKKDKSKKPKKEKNLLQESIFMLQPENIFLGSNKNPTVENDLEFDSKNTENSFEHGFERIDHEKNNDHDEDHEDHQDMENYDIMFDDTKPTIGDYGNFQGNPFETDYYINRSLMRQYMEKDEKYPFLSYLNMDLDSLENMNDRINRRVGSIDHEIVQSPEEINKDLENDSNMILNHQGTYPQPYSLEQKENFYNIHDFESNTSIEDFQQGKDAEEMRKYMRILDL